MQDSTFRLIDSGKMDFASGSSMTLSESCYRRIFTNFEHYRHKILLRPQDITNAAEVIQRLGIIAISTALECDIYGNVNSSHISGSHIVNGIGGSADLRGLSPRQKAQAILNHCVHPSYHTELRSYFERACLRGGHTPHLLEELYQLHTNLAATGSMKTPIPESI